MKKCTVLILGIVLLFNSCVFAMPTQKKNETVYINLGEYGDVAEINIYSKCILNGTENILDYTNYSEVTNLTNRNEYAKSGDELNWNVSGEKIFAYTGKVGEEYFNLIPWNFNIIYKLNGVETTKDKLIGASGLVEIDIEINANEEANEYYKNNYILEITGEYDMSEYLSLESEDAMITENGNSKTLMFIVLPGQSTELKIEIGTEDFQMDGITMAMVPLSGDLLNEMAELVEEKNKMEDALEAMNSSTDVVLNSLYGMNSGLKGISAGVTELKNGVNDVHNLSSPRDEDIEKLKQILTETLPIIQNTKEDLYNLRKTYETTIDSLNDLNDEVMNLADNINELNKELKELEIIAKDLPDDVEEINKLLKYTSDVTADMKFLLSAMGSSSNASIQEVETAFETIGKYAGNISSIAENCKAQAGENEDLKKSLISIEASANGISSIIMAAKSKLASASSSSSNASSVASDLSDLSKQLKKVSNILDEEDAEVIGDTISDIKAISTTLNDMLDIVIAYNDELIADEGKVYIAIDDLVRLVDELSEMDTLSLSMISNMQSMLSILSSEIYSGSNKTTDSLINVNNQLINISQEANAIKNSKNEFKEILDNRVDEIEEKTTIFNIEKDAKVVSFGSEKNENVDSVQFILKTPDIKKVKVENNDMEKESEPQTFWERLLHILDILFGWIKRL